MIREDIIQSIINNQLYDDLADTWWDENSPLYLLKAMVNPWRVPYFTRVLRDHLGKDLTGVTLLDIGCGGGFLAEEFARLGCQVTGIDISPGSIAAARDHAEREKLQISYRVGSAEGLEFDSASFEVVSCCDLLEHILDWRGVIAEVSRVLKPDGLFLFDTINRTPQSWATMIFGLQNWPFTALFPGDTHIWRMFIKPQELTGAMKKEGILLQELSGGVISKNPLATLSEVRRYKTGKISASELGQNLGLQHSPDLSQNYLGYGQKTRNN